jgi:triacylglycerol lipase
MSMFTKLPSEFYDAAAFDGFSSDRDFHRGTAKAMVWLSQLAYETDEPKKIEAILSTWKLRLVEEVISELRSVLPMASTHAFVAAGRGATFITFAGTDPVVLANWISDFDTHMTSSGVAEGYAKATSIVLERIKEIATKRPNAEKKLFLCGHSLGGALAVVTASRLAANASTAVNAVYTFGCHDPEARLCA